MKLVYKYMAIVVASLILGCSKNDNDSDVTTQTIESFDPVSIEFVDENGVMVTADDCITPDKFYEVQITTVKNVKGNTDVSKIEYTVNGALYSMSFSQAGTKRNPITLVDGRNIIELVKTSESVEVNYVKQGDFEEVL